MWVLECDGDILNNKRIWLRPGKTYLFGRTKPETSRYQTGFRINHKTVSRKHLTITVASSGAEQANVLSKRTELTFEDAGTKAGTKIDGERINSGSQKIFSGTQHTFMLSSYEHAFRVTWKSVVLSFTFSSKEFKEGKDPLQPVLHRLAGLDIKAISNYAATKTTHVVASKRNTARGLQALIQGARIVTDEFVTAVEVAATPSDLNHLESFAPLEEDFDAAWPDDSAFLPPPGREPGVKDPELFEPDRTRQDVFKGMTFVFCDGRQFENLQPAITDGGGKAILFELDLGKTSAPALHRFVKNTAGEKDDGELADDSQVVLVKFGASPEFEEWSNQLQHDTALLTGHRLMEQNEFLDAILTNNAMKLVKRLESDYGLDSANHANTSGNTDSSARQSDVPEAAAEIKPIATRRRLREQITPVFRGFDDGFDPSEIQRQRMAKRLDADDESVTSGVNGASSSQDRPRAGSKRPAESDSDVQEIEEDKMFPGAAMMKRRRLEGHDFSVKKPVRAERSSRSRSTTAPPYEVNKEKKAKQETDIRAVVRSRRQAYDDRDEEEEGTGMNGVEDMTVSQMKELAVIEEIEVAQRQPLAERSAQQPSDRWKDEWNGRKNFKKFRRQGESENAARRSNQSVIVPLEEIKRKENGLGANLWGDRENRPTHRYRQRMRAGWDDEIEEGHEDDDAASAPRDPTQRSKTSRITDTQNQSETNGSGAADQVYLDVDDNDTDDVVELGSLRTSRSNGVTQQGQTSQGTGVPSKRTATQTSGEKMTGSKRQRRLDESQRRRAGSDSDSGDDLKFKFRRRN